MRALVFAAAICAMPTAAMADAYTISYSGTAKHLLDTGSQGSPFGDEVNFSIVQTFTNYQTFSTPGLDGIGYYAGYVSSFIVNGVSYASDASSVSNATIDHDKINDTYKVTLQAYPSQNFPGSAISVLDFKLSNVTSLSFPTNPSSYEFQNALEFRGLAFFKSVSGAAYYNDVKLSAVNITGNPFPVTPTVPEPSAWAMMIGGFGLAGAALRRRKYALRVSLA